MTLQETELVLEPKWASCHVKLSSSATSWSLWEETATPLIINLTDRQAPNYKTWIYAPYSSLSIIIDKLVWLWFMNHCWWLLHSQHADKLAHSPCPLPLWGLAWCWYTSWRLSPRPWSPTCRQRSSPVSRIVDSPPYLWASSSPFGTSSPPPSHAAWRFSACAPPHAAPAHAPPRCVCTSSSYSSAPCMPAPLPSRSTHRGGRGRTSPAAGAASLQPGSWGWP